MIRTLRAAAVSAFARYPGLRRAVHAAWEPIFHFALLPFRLPSGRGAAVEQRDLVRRTEEYNRAAERYYAEYPDPRYLLDKPFSDTPDFAAHLIAVGVLVAGARLRPGDTVVEFGAGSCWLSHFLNRFGCRTISVDVSETALAVGRRAFERDPRTNWSLDPQFLPYDGYTLPLEDASCDRVVVCDAFHHVPNQRVVLAEMFRVLTPDGIVAMSEPGRGHASNPTSLAETAATGVLENELVIEDLAVLAEDVGFREVNVLAEGPTRRHEIPVRHIGPFKGGRGFRRYWRGLCREIVHHHYVLLYKGNSRTTTERPGKLSSEIRIVGPAGPVALSCGERLRVDLRVENIGDTCWLHRGVGDSRAGWTRVGTHLHEAGEPLGKVIDFDWHRAGLDGDVEPEDSVRVRCDLPAIHRPGAYDLRFDLVVEGLTWFADRGASRPPRLRVDVS